MKITRLLIGACLLPVLTGCHKPQAGDAIGAAEATIKTTALASITAKFPNVSSSELEFGEMSIRTMLDGKEQMFVIYELSATAKTSMEGMQATTTTKTISVRMSPSGKVERIDENTSQVTYNVGR